MWALLLSRLRSYALPLLVLAAVVLCVRVAQLRLEASEARAIAAEARAVTATAAYASAVAALQQMELETSKRQSSATEAVREVERVRVETVEKIVYLEAQPTPTTCPAAVQFLVDFGRDF